MNGNLDQHRAKHALREIKLLKNNGSYSKYPSYVKSLPAAILQNGLGQAMATLLAASGKAEDGNSKDDKSTPPHDLLYEHIEGWLCSDDEDAPYRSEDSLMDAIVSSDEDHYILAQAEALAYLGWLKKFSAAYLVEKKA